MHDNNRKKYFSLKQFCERNKLCKKNVKYRNIHNITNRNQATINNITHNESTKLISNLKYIKSDLYLNKLFSIKPNLINGLNNFRDSIYFNKQGKKRIYKSYFSDGNHKLIKRYNKNNNNYFKALNNDSNIISRKKIYIIHMI